MTHLLHHHGHLRVVALVVDPDRPGVVYTVLVLSGGKSETFTVVETTDDGANWTPVNTNTLTSIATRLYVGAFTYAASSQNPNVHSVSFDSVSLTGDVVGPPGVSISPTSETAYTRQSATFTALPSGIGSLSVATSNGATCSSRGIPARRNKFGATRFSRKATCCSASCG